MQSYLATASLIINGATVTCLVEPRRTLLDMLRKDLDLPDTRQVCALGDCGACMVLIDGLPMYACAMLAIDCHQRKITTD
jgi:carbon-monoxide dehydrogenase small subunit